MDVISLWFRAWTVRRSKGKLYVSDSEGICLSLT